MMDPVVLSRIQFALTISFHYIFPVFSIGLGLILVIMEGLYLKTNNPMYHKLTQFWVTIFALIFGIGVATGLVMEFQFGTNWANYARFVGDVFGSALAAEGLFAFFLESGFLAILLFGWDKVSKKMHFFSTVMVAMGAHFSAVWIVIANSWQQTPAGFHLVQHNGLWRAEIIDFWAMVFNPSSMSRLAHVIPGAWLAGAFLVMSVSAFYLLKNRHIEEAKAGMKIGLCVAVVASMLQLVTGHESALVLAKHQPIKLAAMEGHFESEGSAPIHLGGWIDEKNRKVIGPAIPGGLSMLVHMDMNKPVKGLNSVPKSERPPLQIVFQSFHAMVALGMLMIALTVAGLYCWKKGTLYTNRPLLWLFVVGVLFPQLANQFGWWTAEVGRQPWSVYGLLRTQHSASVSVSPDEIMISIILFACVYMLLFILFLFLLDRKIKRGPHELHEDDADQDPRLTIQGREAIKHVF